MAACEQLLRIAQGELGVREFPAGSNRVKYNTAYYGREVYDTETAQYPWCVTFIWWLFQKAGAPELFFGGGKTASCGVLMDHAKAHGLFVSGNYQPGDLVFFRFQGKGGPQHVGLVKEVRANGDLVTVEGNTGSDNDANGGQVQKRIRSNTLIVGAHRPRYQAETEEDSKGMDIDIEGLTKEQLIRLAERMQNALAERPISNTLAAELEEAKAMGITSGSSPNAFCTRAQAAVMVARSMGK